MVQPSIEAALRDRSISGLSVLHVVIVDPLALAPEATFEQAVLVERSIGPRDQWDVDYAAYAYAKARLSWTYHKDSRLVVWTEPQQQQPGEPPGWGAVWLDGLIVAASGAQPIWDEAFSLSIAAALRALAWSRVSRLLNEAA